MPRSLLIVAALEVGCFHAPVEGGPAPGSLVMEGDVCAREDGAQRPLKVLIAVHSSPSLQVTDPSGARARAIRQLLASRFEGRDVWAAVMLFSGSVTAFPIDFRPQFRRVSELGPADLDGLEARMLAPLPGGDAADFVRPLSAIYELIARDLTDEQLVPGRPTPAYSVLFVSDGAPTVNQDAELLCGDAVRRLHAVGGLGNELRVNTAHLFLGPVTQAGCAGAPPGGTACALPSTDGLCAAQAIEVHRERLQRMAAVGGGEFRDFREGSPVDFSFVLQGREALPSLRSVIVSNLNALPGSSVPDSDADGLSDAQELELGLNADASDTDGDGYSDGVERWASARSGAFSPTGKDVGCENPGNDDDCDGLSDCDERVLGSNRSRIDTDDDGVPDAVEWQHGTRLTVADHLLDLDVDGTTNGDEARRHTDPAQQDTAQPTSAYRYQLEPTASAADGAACHRLRVDNIAASATHSGRNSLYLSSTIDVPGGRPIHQQLRVEVPVGSTPVRFGATLLRSSCTK